MKRKIQDLSEREKIQTLDALYTATASLRGRDAMKLFLRDLLTESERVMLGRRILIAHMLIEGRERDSIMEELKVGPDTVQRVQRWLSDSLPGFENAIKGLRKELDKRELKRLYAKAEPFSYAWMKKRYPLHFLLFPIPKSKLKRKS